MTNPKPKGAKVPTKKPVKKAASSKLLFSPKRPFNKSLAFAIAGALAIFGIYVVYRSHAAAPPPPAGGYFQLQPVGAWKTLPSDSQCASQVHQSAWEPRSANTAANQVIPTGVTLRPWPAGSTTSDYNTWMLPRVSGNFKGTTDEIIQWAACKWGWPDDVIRAEMVVESNWYQNLKDSQGRTISGSGYGDYTTTASLCPAGYTPTTPYISGGTVNYGCPRGFGVLQATWEDGNGPFGNYPAIENSTAFDIDFVAGTLRACYEGMETWLKQTGTGTYAAGDMWGCIGRWYSGDWHSAAAEGYITKVQQSLNSKAWLSWADQSGSTATSPTVKFDFEDGTTQSWIKDYGTTTTVSNTTAFANTGTHGLAINTNPTTADYPGIAVYSGLSGLSGGLPVTYWLYQPAGSTLSGVVPYAYDGAYKWYKSSIVPLVAGWNKVTWTLPSMTSVGGIGLELENPNAWKGQLVLDSVSWGSPTASDTAAPSQPAGLTATPQSTSQLNLSWTASTDNVGVTGYDVYRNNVKLTTVAATSLSDTGLAASTSYSYYVIARDAAGNSSPASTTVSATTQTPVVVTDTTAPTATINSPLNGSTIGNSVSIQATATDNKAVTKMQIYIDGNLYATSSTGSIFYSWNSKKAAAGSHAISVRAYDAAGNVGTRNIVLYK